MSESPHRGRRYSPPQGGDGSYGPPPPYEGPQWQQQPRQQSQPPAQQWQGQQQQPAQQQWQQPQQQPPQQWQGQQQQQWQGQSYDQYGGGHDDVAAAASLPLAPIHRRAAARVLDNALVAVFGFALVLPISIGAIGLDAPGSKANSEGGVWNWSIIFVLFCVLSVLPLLYEAVQLSLWGRTLGKRVLHLGVVQARPAGAPLTTTQAVWRSGITHVAYQFGVFFFLALAVMLWSYFAYGMLLVWAGALMAYLWAIWDQPLHQSLHDRFAGTLVIDERVADDDEYGEYAEYEG